MNLQDPDWCSRWEYLQSLLRDMLKASGSDLQRKAAPNAAPCTLERKRVALALLVRLLEEDLHCWVRLRDQADDQPSAQLSRKSDVPLIARLLWPQTDIASRLSAPCRELMNLHNEALVIGIEFPRDCWICIGYVGIFSFRSVTTGLSCATPNPW